MAHERSKVKNPNHENTKSWRPFRVSGRPNKIMVDRVHRTSMSSFGSVQHEPTGHYGPRFQERYELVVLRTGSMTAFIDDMRFDFSAGQLVLLRPGHREWLKFDDHVRSIRDWVTLHREIVPASLASRLAVAPMAVMLSDEFLALVDTALALPEEITPMTELAIDHMALALLAMYLRKVEKEVVASNALPVAVIRSIEFMELNLPQQLSLKDIAGAACITSHHLIKLFTAHLGMPPAKYLWRMRLQRAGELLRRTALSIAEIAYMVGFQSPFHFSRSFKAAYGTSPKAYRDSI